MTLKKILSLLIIVMLVSNFNVYSSENPWRISYNISNVNINSVTHAGCKIDVAVCDEGIIRVSTNGGVWRAVDSGTTNSLFQVAWNGKEFIAVGENGTILTSNNGINWRSVDSKVSEDLKEIVCVKNRTLIMGEKGTVVTSNDLRNWKSAKIKSTFSPYQVIWTGKKYIAVLRDDNKDRGAFDQGDISYIATSVDGQKWKTYKFDGELNTVAYNGKTYVALGNDIIVTSKDAVKWNVKSLSDISEDGANADISKVIWNGKVFVGVGNYSENQYFTMSSKNGADWECSRMDASFYGGLWISDLIWTGKEFFATVKGAHPPGDPYGEILESDDGDDWQKLSNPCGDEGAGTSFYDISWDGKRFIAVGNDNLLLSSSDPINSSWNTCTVRVRGDFGDEELGYVFWNGKEFIFANCDRNLYKSNNGIDWSDLNTPIEATNYMKKNYSNTNYLKMKIANYYGIFNMIYDGKNFIALDGNETIADPEIAVYDNIILESGKVQGNIHFGGLAINSNKITTLGNIWNDNVLYVGNSVDGQNWTISKAKINIANYSVIGVNDLLYADGKYLAAVDVKIDGNEENLILESKDSINWTKVNQSDGESCLAYRGNTIVATGNGTVLTSDDGINWLKNKLAVGNTNVICIENKFYITGCDGILLTSIDGKVWNKEELIDDFTPVSVSSNGKRVIIINLKGDILYRDI